MKLLIQLYEWVDARMPITKVWNEHLAQYYTPKNFNFWYYFGSLAILVLVMQILSGIWLTMHYKPDAEMAFTSLQYIRRDVPGGWFIADMHAVGASFFFIVIYLHMFRALLYGSYRGPRELIWILGMVIYVALMAESFTGYLLPWGNMSYWGAQVIVNLFDAIPLIGPGLSEWIRGDYVIADATLNRFFAFHVVAIPLALVGLVFLHIVALHKVGSGSPDGIEIKQNKGPDGIPVDGIPFHPYYTVKDIVGVAVFLIIFFTIVFFVPGLWGWFLERDNFVPANILVTPPDIVPLWYFTPFYTILRAVTINPSEYLPFLPFFTAKLLGVISMGLAIVLLFFLPWLDRSPVKSIRYRGWMYKTALALFVISFFVLGYLGTKSTLGHDILGLSNLFVGQVGYFVYFAFFIFMPWYTKYDKTKPVPERVVK